jgi:APA family basic amino acid/polyamine antiporter
MADVFGVRKPLATLMSISAHQRLKQTLSWPHLVALGVGAIVGTGIYTLTGVGADRAGPAVIIAFAIAGAVCAFAALAYAELATMMPVAGSAYTYTYVALGEVAAWVIGWSLILEYSVACSAVASGWSAYVGGFLHSAGIHFPEVLLKAPNAGGIVNLPAVLISLVVTALLAVGTKESANINMGLVVIKLVALVFFVALTLPAIQSANFEPFMPYGFTAHVEDGVQRGVMAAAAIVFFAFFGFDAVSTSAEESKRPGRDLTIGILGSMVLCTLIYMAVAACAVGAWPFQEFAKSGEPLALILRGLNHPLAATLVAAAAIIALPTVIMVMMFGQSRVFFVMARDGLLPPALSRVNQRFGTPMVSTILIGILVSLVAGFFRLDEIAELSNAGTLAAFIAVAICVMVLRRTNPDAPRVFSTPAVWIVAPLAIVGCLYLFYSLPAITQKRFLIWNVIGLVLYFAYGRRYSLQGAKSV